jgi:hypothetical protein
MSPARLTLVALSFIAVQSAQAQRAERIGFVPTFAQSGQGSASVETLPPGSTLSPILARVALTPNPFATKAAELPGNSGMPRWLRWGLVGAVGGAVLFTLVDGLNGNSHSVGSDILAGAATGFVVVGGGVLVYDAISSNGSR